MYTIYTVMAPTLNDQLIANGRALQLDEVVISVPSAVSSEHREGTHTEGSHREVVRVRCSRGIISLALKPMPWFLKSNSQNHATVS